MTKHRQPTRPLAAMVKPVGRRSWAANRVTGARAPKPLAEPRRNCVGTAGRWATARASAKLAAAAHASRTPTAAAATMAAAATAAAAAARAGERTAVLAETPLVPH